MLFFIGIGQHKLFSYQCGQRVVGSDESAQGAHGRAISVKFINRHAVFIIGFAKIREMRVKAFKDRLVYRVIYSRLNFHI